MSTRNNVGFTLIELLVVISMVGILGTVTIASFNNYSSQQAVNQAALSVKAMIEKAKFSAVSKIKPSVCASGDNLRWYEFDIQGNTYQINVQCGGSGGSYHHTGISSVTLVSPFTIDPHPCTAYFWVTSNSGKIFFGNNGANPEITFGNKCNAGGGCGAGNRFCLQVQANGITKLVNMDVGGNVSIQ